MMAMQQPQDTREKQEQDEGVRVTRRNLLDQVRSLEEEKATLTKMVEDQSVERATLAKKVEDQSAAIETLSNQIMSEIQAKNQIYEDKIAVDDELKRVRAWLSDMATPIGDLIK